MSAVEEARSIAARALNNRSWAIAALADGQSCRFSLETFDLTRIIHERFACNRPYAAATSLAIVFSWPSGQARPSRPPHTGSSMRRSLRAPRARLA